MSDENVTPEASLEPASKSAWVKPIIFGIIILFCGMVIGSGITFKFLWTRTINKYQNPNWAKTTTRITRRIDRRLDLTDDQEIKLLGIIDKRMNRIASLRKKVRPRFQAEYVAMSRDIRQILTPEQAARWDKDMEKFLGRWFKKTGKRNKE